jgi:hypothetical protein
MAIRDAYFNASDPAEKGRLREELAEREDGLVSDVFERARRRAHERLNSPKADVKRLGQQVLDGLAPLESQFKSRDRVFPLFLPAFHAPDVMRRGGWDIVVMNPPYVGRKEVASRLPALRVEDLKAHYGRTYDLMLAFALRALELVRDGGVLSMIFNDTVFTSFDADDLRRAILPADPESVALHTVSRTRCFEDVAVNGGVIVASRLGGKDPEIRWAENAAGDGRRPADLMSATLPTAPGGRRRSARRTSSRRPAITTARCRTARSSVPAARRSRRSSASSAAPAGTNSASIGRRAKPARPAGATGSC